MVLTKKVTTPVGVDKPLRSLWKNDGKKIDAVSLVSFLSVVVAIPVWALTVLPLSICYQVGKAILTKKSPPASSSSNDNKQPDGSATTTEGSVEIAESDIIPQKDRQYDVVLLGASGYTGSFAVTHLVETYGTGGNKNDDDNNKEMVKWAIAGRSKSKLIKTLENVAMELGIDKTEIVNNVDILIVDTSDATTMPNLVKNTRVVATTAGPFQLYGSPVVEYCAKYGTHYVDITGEIDWVRTMIVEWEETAKRTGSKIVSLCGHDSIPWDLTVMKLEEGIREHSAKGEEDLVEVNIYDDVKAAASGGTMATMKLALNGEMIQAPTNCEFDPFMRLEDGTKSPYETKLDLPSFVSTSAKLPKESNNTVTGPFVMSTVNGNVVKRSHALRKHSYGNNSNKNGGDQEPPPLVYREAKIFPDYKSAFVNFFGEIIFFTSMLNPITRLLIEGAGLIPEPGTILKGVTIESMKHEFFLSIAAVGIGSKGTKVESIMYFRRDPGYLDTARMLIESALCFVGKENGDLPKNGGGFYTPSTAFGNVLLDRLCKTGTHFQMRVVQE